MKIYTDYGGAPVRERPLSWRNGKEKNVRCRWKGENISFRGTGISGNVEVVEYMWCVEGYGWCRKGQDHTKACVPYKETLKGYDNPVYILTDKSHGTWNYCRGGNWTVGC